MFDWKSLWTIKVLLNLWGVRAKEEMGVRSARCRGIEKNLLPHFDRIHDTVLELPINICSLRNIWKRRNGRNISVNFAGKYSQFGWQPGRSTGINKSKSEDYRAPPSHPMPRLISVAVTCSSISFRFTSSRLTR